MAIEQQSENPPTIPLTRCNDFSMVVATVNGSGSQTANLAIMRAFFRMGIPTSGKNLFPSNIQGLPTWFIIRTNPRGFTARRDHHDILIAMNQATVQEDVNDLPSGAVVFYADHLNFEPRTDLVMYPIPVRDLLREVNPPRNFRDYITNMAYVGVVAQVLGIPAKKLENALLTHFNERKKPVELNMSMIVAAMRWAAGNIVKQDPFCVEEMEQSCGRVMMDGNTAAALGSIYGGVGFVGWYPITPASSLAEELEHHIAAVRTDPETGKRTYAIVQAEDELSAVGMAIGAGWAGARSMTSTSGPGICLMSELVGLAYAAEIPIVIWNVQRMGPSTGLPTRTSQGDILFTRYLGHGDTNQVMLLPGSVKECFEFGWRAFDYAERLQTPVFVMSDLDLGMNVWVSDDFEYPDEPIQRGKILTAEDLERLGTFGRYRDVDGDGIPYRTLPGTDHPLAGYFTRGTGHDEDAKYSEDPEDWERNMARLTRKYEGARAMLPAPLLEHQGKEASIGLLAYGSTDIAVQEAICELDDRLDVDYMRIRAIPFAEEVTEFIVSHERIYVIEMNSDGQLHKLLQLEAPQAAMRLRSIRKNDGLSLTAAWITEQLLTAEEA